MSGSLLVPMLVSLQAWDYWVSWTNWFTSLVVSHSVSLENCLDAFFCPDKLVGDDMYSCEKCKK